MAASVTYDLDLLTIGEVAELSGAATSAIRFYERKGLIEAQRTSGNQRRYATWVPCIVKVARVAQRVGLSIHEISDVLDRMPENPAPEDWQQMTDHLVAEAERRIGELRLVLADLRSDTKLCEVPNHAVGRDG